MIGFPFSEYDKECSVDSNCMHMMYMLEGYRCYVFGDREPPYSPGSPRDVSWKIGYEQAKKDLGEV
jgi:hypothetical protein